MEERKQHIIFSPSNALPRSNILPQSNFGCFVCIRWFCTPLKTQKVEKKHMPVEYASQSWTFHVFSSKGWETITKTLMSPPEIKLSPISKICFKKWKEAMYQHRRWQYFCLAWTYMNSDSDMVQSNEGKKTSNNRGCVENYTPGN